MKPTNCLYFIYARKFYVGSQGIITRQLKSTLRGSPFICLVFDNVFALMMKPRSQLPTYQHNNSLVLELKLPIESKVQ